LLYLKAVSMKHRKSAGDKTFEEIVKMSSLLPWWVSVGVAILLFFFIPLNISVSGGSFTPNQITGMLVGMFFGAIFKYFVPMALLFGGLTNLLKRGKSAWMFNSINSNGARETLSKLSWKDFEFLISEYFKKQNYKVDLVDAQGADGGIDIKLYKDGELYLVQCKHYKARKVPVQVVRELYGVMTAENAQGGFVITTGKFTKDAVSFAEGKEIDLIDGNQLEIMLEDSLNTLSVQNTDDETGICPRCGNKLIRRKGNRGEFWGCSSFPKCRYTSDFK
jgi:restriction system protein